MALAQKRSLPGNAKKALDNSLFFTVSVVADPSDPIVKP